MAPVRQRGGCSLYEVQRHGDELSVLLSMGVACAPEFCLLLKWPVALAAEGDLEKVASVLGGLPPALLVLGACLCPLPPLS